MALKNTTFRLPDEDIQALKDLAEQTGIKSGELKRRVVSVGLKALQAELDNQSDDTGVHTAFAGIVAQQKKVSDLIEKQLSQAEKAVERQKAQAESVIQRMTQQQRRLSDGIEKQVAQAEKALNHQKAQVDRLLEALVSQPRRLSEQVRGHLPRLADFDWRRRGENTEEAVSLNGEAEVEADAHP